METTEKPKRTYQKHKTEKKITIKHYVNSDVKVDDSSDYTMYPVYVQVTYNRKNTKFRSNIPYSLSKNISYQIPIFDRISGYYDYYTKSCENNINNDFDSSFQNALIRETNFINWLINQQILNRPNTFDISQISTVYHLEVYRLVDFFETCLKKEIQSSLFEIAKHYIPNEMFKNFEFPIFHHIPALSNLEFYISQYPQLVNLKEKYSSHIWLLDFYLSEPELSNGNTLEPVFSITNPHDDSVISLTPTIYDYVTGIFQPRFLEIFENKQFAYDIIYDMNTLFEKYMKPYG